VLIGTTPMYAVSNLQFGAKKQTLKNPEQNANFAAIKKHKCLIHMF
jgi:hypothetical protein